MDFMIWFWSTDDMTDLKKKTSFLLTKRAISPLKGNVQNLDKFTIGHLQP